MPNISSTLFFALPRTISSSVGIRLRSIKAWWPDHWYDTSGVPLYYDPVVVLVRALYGHPESGALWDRHLRVILVRLRWRRVESHPGLYVHEVTMAVLVVYVDDLLLAAPPAEEARLWAEIEKHVSFGGDPEPIAKFLGGHHFVSIDRGVTTATCQMKEFVDDAECSGCLLCARPTSTRTSSRRARTSQV